MPGNPSSPPPTISATLTKPDKTTMMPVGKEAQSNKPKIPESCFSGNMFAGALLFLSSFISQNQRTMARDAQMLRKMDDRAILKQNQNNKIGNKEIAHPEQGGESCHKAEVFKMVAPAEALLHLKRNEKERMAVKDYFHYIKPVQQKTKPPYGEAVQKDGDRYRELMGLRCCSLSHQVAPHLSLPPDQQPSSALLATHIHLLVDFFLLSLSISIAFTLMCLNIVSSICFQAVKYSKDLKLLFLVVLH